MGCLSATDPFIRGISVSPKPEVIPLNWGSCGLVLSAKMSMFQLTYLFEGVSKSFSPTRKLAWLRLSSTFPWVWPDLVFFPCLVSFQFLCEFLKHFLHFSLLAKAYFISYSELSLMKAVKILPSYHEISQQSTISPGNQSTVYHLTMEASNSFSSYQESSQKSAILPGSP